MLVSVLLRVKGLVLLAVLAVALAATGFGHPMPEARDAALLAFVAAGGTLADLCGDQTDPGDPGHLDCPACPIASHPPHAPGPPRITAADLIFVATVVAPRESRALRHVPDPSRSSQSPPLA